MNYIRMWVKISADRPDKYISNSNFVSSRIKKYYNKDACIISPPVNTGNFHSSENANENANKDYYLMVGRALPYKRFDIVIKAFNELGLPLKIIGKGPEMNKLKKRSKSNIEFLGYLNDRKMSQYYSKCKAFIFPSEEDFGITPLEAMASGRPVIAFRGGGVLETVVEGKTGLFFNQQTPQSLINTLKSFDPNKFDPKKIRNHVLKFDKEVFKKKIKRFVEEEYNKFKM
jgi:glycosyltransferase involved in cell wall biosynthesis